jgi:CBS domain-containing protein
VRRALGWSSARDIQAQGEGQSTDAEHPSTASEIMQKEVETITPDEPLRAALRRMLQRGIHSLPVVEGRKLVGIVTSADFTKAVAHEDLL